MIRIFAGICLILYQTTAAITLTPSFSPTSSGYHITINVHIEPEEILLKDFIKVSPLQPSVEITDLLPSHAPLYFDDEIHTQKEGWNHDVSFSFSLHNTHPSTPAALIFYYKTNKMPAAQDILFTLPFEVPTDIEVLPKPEREQKPFNTSSSSPLSTPFQTLYRIVSSSTQSIASFFSALQDIIATRIRSQQSFFLQFILVFMLGILMSLTPCIYPMIPITIGVLQSPTQSSLLRNFILALSYTMGLSTTFALLGLLAACGSMHFGQLLGNPLFVIFICAFLLYLAFSMFGFYELYIPRFLQPKSHTVKQGSLPSAFIFGVMSGSFASPCLSPGLMFLLSVCATIGYKIYSFFLLFSFGLGLGLPLLIIGTFSTSLNHLPRAGMWMLEIKKIFGFLLIGLCLYYASTFIPPFVTLLMITVGLILIGIYYLALSNKKFMSKGIKRFHHIVGTGCIIVGFVSAAQTYKAFSLHEKNHTTQWLSDYQEARKQARAENKTMILDFGAAWCTLCKKLDAQLLHNSELQPFLQNFMLVSVDCTHAESPQCAQLTEQFAVKGYPTMIIIDPLTENVLARFGSELLGYNIEDFVALLEPHR